MAKLSKRDVLMPLYISIQQVLEVLERGQSVGFDGLDDTIDVGADFGYYAYLSVDRYNK